MPRKLDWRAAVQYITRDEQWISKLFRGGLYIAIFPPVGWIMALGYRSLAGAALVKSNFPLLPEWNSNHLVILIRGIGAVGVILTYFLPFFVLYWWIGLNGTPEYWYIALFFIGSIAYPPLFIPVLPVIYPFLFEWVSFSQNEIIGLLILFIATVFFLPSAFTNVALHGTYKAAFRPKSILLYVIKHPVLYLEAWLFSLLVSAVAVLSGILIPWGLLWSYIAILYIFNEALLISGTPGVDERFRNSVLLSNE